MSNISSLITSLNSKIEKLVFLHMSLQEENQRLLQEREQLLQRINASQISGFGVESRTSSKESKEKLNKIITELDRIIHHIESAS
jgi:cell division septum initiation protein DivIVA